MATKDDVVDQVKAQVSDARTRLAMLVGSALEGGWGPRFGVGDNGESVGPFQIRTTVHPDISRGDATDPAKSVAYMKGRYASAVAQVPGDVWSATPEVAAAEAAYLAERPAMPYQQSQGQAAVDAAYKRSKSALGGGGGFSLNPVTDLNHIGGAIGGIPGDIAGAASSAAGSVVGPVVNDVKNFTIKLAFVGLGLTFIVVGGYQVAKPVTSKLGVAMPAAGGGGAAEAAPAIPPAAAAAAL